MSLPEARRKAVIALVVTAVAAVALWAWALTTAVEYFGREPVAITITECRDAVAKSRTAGCTGTWTDAEGVARSGKVTANPDHRPGETVDGVSLGDAARIDPYGWIVEMLLGFPAAIAATAGLAWGVRVLRRARVRPA